ncbi:MAG: hypothetical protein KGL39_59145 [Patescibacteria group bacterium]|nr:hypothetical protein [Patescibacteria group bacterium]
MNLLDHSQDFHNAASVGLFAGFLSLLNDASPAKLATAFLIALATGAGYKLGTWLIVTLLHKLPPKRAKLDDKTEREK